MYLGHLDHLDGERAVGWIVNSFDPNDQPVVQVLADGEVVASAQACIKRPDLGFGEAGSHAGFMIPIDGLVPAGGTVTVRTEDEAFDFGATNFVVNPVRKHRRIRPTDKFEFPKTLYRADDPKVINFARMVEMAHQAAREDRPIFVVPPFIDWNIDLFQRPQHMCVALAKLGVQVIYFTPGLDVDQGDEILALQDNLILCKLPSFERFMNEAPPVFIDMYSTCYGYSAKRLREWRALGHQIVYEYVDHIDPEISGEHGAKLAMETFRQLNTETVDIVVPTAQILRSEVADRFDDAEIAFSPNGVEIERFQREGEVHPLLQEIREQHPGKPIIGYIGALALWIDFEMIAELAARRPDLIFVFVGPIYDPRVVPAQADNIIYTGPMPYPNVPRLLNGFDVAWIPFRAGDIAQTTSPLKLFEYFAAQKPVVVNADMRECVVFDEVLSGSDAETMSVAVDAALERRDDGAFASALTKHAQAASWQERARVVYDAMKDAPNRLLQHYIRSQIPHKLWKVSSGTLSSSLSSASHRMKFADDVGPQLVPNPYYGHVGDFVEIALDTTALDISRERSWYLRLLLESPEPPKEMMIMIDVLVGGNVMTSFDMKELRHPVEVRCDGKGLHGRSVHIRQRTLRSHARSELDRSILTLKDAAVLSGELSRPVICSAWKTYHKESV